MTHALLSLATCEGMNVVLVEETLDDVLSDFVDRGTGKEKDLTMFLRLESDCFLKSIANAARCD